MTNAADVLLTPFPKKVVKVRARTTSFIFKKRKRGSVASTSDKRERSVYVRSVVNKGLSDPLVNRRPPRDVRSRKCQHNLKNSLLDRFSASVTYKVLVRVNICLIRSQKCTYFLTYHRLHFISPMSINSRFNENMYLFHPHYYGKYK